MLIGKRPDDRFDFIASRLILLEKNQSASLLSPLPRGFRCVSKEEDGMV